jgi:YidC/Oxa1 family membrane protein insertase
MNDQDNQRNMIMAIALSLAVLLGWQYLVVAPKEAERQKQAAAQKSAVPVAQGTQQGAPTGGAAPTATTNGAAGSGSVPSAAGASASAPTGLTREAALKQSPRVAIQTPSLTGSLALKGGRIDDIVLAKYRETTKPDSANVVLLDPAGAKDAYFAEFGWVPAAGQAVVVPGRETVWAQEGNGALTPATPVVLVHDNGQGQVFRRTVSVDDKFMFTVRDDVENKSANPIVLQPYGKIFRLGTPKTTGYAVLHEGLIGVLSPDNTIGLQEVGYGDLAKEAANNEKAKKPAIGEKVFAATKGGWLGFTDKYWAAVLVPSASGTYDAHLTAYKAVPGAQEEGFQTDYVLDPLTIAAGASQSTQSQLFAGAKEVRTINTYADGGIKRFDMMIDWGWFGFIAKPMFYILERLYKILGNFGFAILAITVLVKGAFFPLANKSYESMAKMKKMQPEMEKLREQFKDDRQRQQQEMMKLYKDHKINPASGCLPMLLQFPVFFALYKVLVLTIDMRHAPFVGWVRDLSAGDPSNIFNLLGLLPFDPTHVPLIGEYLHMGVWPMLMGVTMWLTMQLNPQQPDPTQQMMFNWMPVMFTFMMASFPAGLVIYWAWSNLLSLFQQYYIMQKNGADIHLWKNTGLDKWLHKFGSTKT